MIGRRGFIGSLIALVAAPAIVRIESLMPVTPTEVIRYGGRNLLTIDMITREAVGIFRNSNAFLKAIDQEYDEEFSLKGAKIGDVLRIRLPLDYHLTDGDVAKVSEHQLSAPEVALAGAAAVLAKNPSISRRFWSA